ncbi:lipopolysaccharide kinase InaA family protein [Pseudomonas sp. JS3066]|uniref:lipopolysaccharide kinase InaA family protein n=1 Tax=unclassified Pseudomonas TaxID=196821 RepID=UPI000EA8BD73|nr:MULTISPECIES: lipopolysaccharide kinase InaA family protein [unclassified Pseudomonas]AYF89737.1 serine/threonine protein kinase [Pseudomonas sp. DY-1]WVK92688.1 lipopolysaccharide kinase InaA family protein [Pseudomonas sp. JS3066]
MTLAELARAGRSPKLPIRLDVAGGLELQSLLRVLPGQRYVGVAVWQGRRVLAKLLVGGKAERHFHRELSGARALHEHGIDTPELLSEGHQAGQGGWLLFEYLESAESLWDAWREVERDAPLSDGQQAVLGEALGAIARLHLAGLAQEDLHLDNLLRHGGKLQVIDGGGIRAETPGSPLPRDKVMANLGVFFAQLPAELDPFLEELLVQYLLVNGEHALPLEALEKEIARMRQWRLGDYMKKIARDCSLFSVVRGAFGLRAVRRETEAGLERLLQAPDAALEQGRSLKQGATATVAEVQIDGRKLLVKRYNIKGLLHWLTRFWRPSRAWHSWREGNRLEFLGIATPRPLAVLERRFLWLRGRAYLITEYLSGQDIIARFRPYLDNPDGAGAPPEAELQALDRLFATLIRERISHGDFKGYNLFWQDGRWTLIDLDAVYQHRSERSFARAYARDRARFLRNWPAESALHQLLDQRLPQVPGTCPERG